MRKILIVLFSLLIFSCSVYDNYLQGQKEVDFTNNRPEGILADQLKTLFKRRELSYENKDIYKKEF